MKKIISSLKYLKLHDFYDPFIFIFTFIISRPLWVLNKIRRRSVWLVTEDGRHARDNGYYFFKYMRENHVSEPCYYVIDKKGHDYAKVASFGNIIQYRSLRHWIYYLTAEYNISNQKSGNPSTALFYILHVIFGWYNNRVYLKHGLIKDRTEWTFYKNTHFRYFICGAKPEYDYVSKTFGYPRDSVAYTGLARFDGLYDFKINKKQILFMPTWRNWLGRETNFLSSTEDFKTTAFYRGWDELLSSPALHKMLEKNGIEVLFYPHKDMQKYLKEFNIHSKNIKCVGLDTDIQDVLKTSALMVTDYSSVFMDFAYMEKPIIYYQFDESEYRKKQYAEGYFSYRRDGFGDVLDMAENVIYKIGKYIENNFAPEPIYAKRMRDFFVGKDRHNCERIYNLLKGNKNANIICK